ncbi:hypothetical protein ACFGVR_15350 [Mucilaginibacter sp. AW1-3]
MKKIALIVTCIFCHLADGFAQQPKIVPSSPEAASLAKFINYPVNFNTGVPNISIPLFEVNSGSLSLPITLSYHAGGIKVNEKSTWVGLGWSLSAEPEITRTVNGSDDIATFGYSGSDVGNPALNRDLNYMKNIVNGSIDENPDDFYYHLSNKSGKFYMHKAAGGAYNFLPIPYEPLAIKFGQGNIPIQITDETGITYHFGDSTGYTYHHAIEMQEVGDYNSVSTWKCTQMISPSKKDTIFFSYSSPVMKLNYGINEKYVIYDNERTVDDSGYLLGVPIGDGDGGVHVSIATPLISAVYNPERFYDHNGADSIVLTPVTNYHFPAEPGVTITTTNTIKIQEIKYRSGKVQFFLRTNKNMLDSIRVYDSNNLLKKSIKFYYTFWDNTPAVGTPDDRTRLDSIAIRGSNSVTVEKYAFDYNPSYDIPMGMKRSDIRGYHSNTNISFASYITDSESSVPQQTVTIQKPGVHIEFNPLGYLAWGQDPFWSIDNPPYSFDITIGTPALTPSITSPPDFTQAFMLKKIHYPTGGRTEFTYESNQVYDQSQGLTVSSSGLRIKSIKFFKDNTTTSAFEKNYKYGIGETGRGVTTGLENIGTFSYAQTIYRPLVVANEFTFSPWKQRVRTYNARSFSDLVFSDGSPVVYQEVAEYQSDMGSQTGKTVYKYDYPLDFSFYDVDYAPMTLPKTDWHLGTLTSKTDYARANSNYVWVKKNDFTYKKYNRPDSIYVGMAHPVNIIEENPTYPYTLPADTWRIITYAHTALQVGKMLPLREDEYTRELEDTLNYVSQSKYYFYDNPDHMFATRTMTVNSKGDTLTAYSSHPQDYASSDAMVGPMITANMLAYPIEQISAITHAGASQPSITAGSINTYNSDSTPSAAYTLETANPISLPGFKFSNVSLGNLPQGTTKQTFVKDGTYVLKETFNNYDSFGHIRQLTNNQNNVVSYKWGYNNTYPIAECKNANYDEFMFEDFEGNGSIASNYGTTHTGSGSFSGTINLSSYFSSTLHGKAYTLSYFKYNGAGWDYIQADYSGQTISGILDDIRIFPKNALITTYTYQLLTGITSVTDAKGQTTYYEYDAVQRLNTIRDQNGNILKHTDYHYAGQ